MDKLEELKQAIPTADFFIDENDTDKGTQEWCLYSIAKIQIQKAYALGQQERQEKVFQKTIEACAKETNELEKQSFELGQQLAEAKAKFEKAKPYMRHFESCEKNHVGFKNNTFVECTCGFTEAGE